jgi:plastocyanin
MSPFCRVLLVVAGTIGVAAGATVDGKVKLTNSNDSSVNKRGNFAGVGVWLAPAEKSAGTLSRKRVQMRQKDKTFTPHVLVIATGTTVDFPNLDPIFHNAFSSFNGQIFDLGLYQPGSSASMRFTRPGVVRVFCNIHPAMSAVIVVVDSAYFGTTREDGSFSIAGVPPGTYQVNFFHERSAPETLDKLSSAVAVAEGIVRLSPVTISETGYLPVPHKNKYGHDYSPNGDEQQNYSILAK